MTRESLASEPLDHKLALQRFRCRMPVPTLEMFHFMRRLTRLRMAARSFPIEGQIVSVRTLCTDILPAEVFSITHKLLLPHNFIRQLSATVTQAFFHWAISRLPT